MVRTQIYLTEPQHAALHRAAQRQGVSLTEVLRRLIDRHLLARGPAPDFDKEAVLSFIGLGESGHEDTSERHDEALDAALRRPDLR